MPKRAFWSIFWEFPDSNLIKVTSLHPFPHVKCPCARPGAAVIRKENPGIARIIAALRGICLDGGFPKASQAGIVELRRSGRRSPPPFQTCASRISSRKRFRPLVQTRPRKGKNPALKGLPINLMHLPLVLRGKFVHQKIDQI
jgi:hypothetical protein